MIQNQLLLASKCVLFMLVKTQQDMEALGKKSFALFVHLSVL